VQQAHGSLQAEVLSLTQLCNRHVEALAKLESKVERGATSLGGGSGRSKFKLLEVKSLEQDAAFQRQVSSRITGLAGGEVRATWCQTEMFGLGQNFGLLVEEEKPMTDTAGTQTRVVDHADSEAQATPSTIEGHCQTEKPLSTPRGSQTEEQHMLTASAKKSDKYLPFDSKDKKLIHAEHA